MAVMLICSGVVMDILESISYKAEMKFPIVNCIVVEKTYTNEKYNRIEVDQWKRDSLNQYKMNMAIKASG
tara:strand:+ start:496 stop:705 length:210 start_codon:yes stop_codon:yes gene_type:complete